MTSAATGIAQNEAASHCPAPKRFRSDLDLPAERAAAVRVLATAGLDRNRGRLVRVRGSGVVARARFTERDRVQAVILGYESDLVESGRADP